MNRWFWLVSLLALAFGAVACGDDGGDDDDDMMVGDDDDDMAGDDDDDDDDLPPIFQAIAADEDLSSLNAAIEELIERDILNAILLAILDGFDGITVFAPTNEGFDAAVAALGLPSDLADATDEQMTTLFGIIAYHIVPATLDAATITGDGFPGKVGAVLGLTTSGAPEGNTVNLYFDLEDGVGIRYFDTMLMEQTSSVTEADVDVPGDDAAVIHKVDQVIVPPDVFAVALFEGLTGFAAAVAAADPIPGDTPVPVRVALADPSASYTVFVPDNDALSGELPPSNLLTGILLYHVLSEEDPVFSTGIPARADAIAGFTMLLDAENAQINGGSGGGAPVLGANITETDFQAANGVVHVIDNVLPPPTVAAMAQIAGLDALVMTAAQVDAVAGGEDPIIIDLLNNPAATLTVLAPTDAAFEAATGEGGPANGADADTLREALLYHVVSGDALAAGDLTDGQVLNTLSMGAAQQPTVSVEGADITFTDQFGQTITPEEGLVDIRVVNGIVHVVDTVLLPLSPL